MLKNTRWEAKICIFVGSSYAVCHESTKIICSAVYKMIKPVSLVQKCYETSILYRDKSQASLVLGCQRIPESQKSISDQIDSHYVGLEDSKKPKFFSEKLRLALSLAPSSFI